MSLWRDPMSKKGIVETNEEMRRKMEKKLKNSEVTGQIKPKLSKKDELSKSSKELTEKLENIKGIKEKDKNNAPAEQILNSIITGVKEKQEQFGKIISEYTKDKDSEEIKTPAVDVFETNDCITVKVDLPGVKKEDIDLGITKKRLDVMTTFPEEDQEENANYIEKERSHGKVSRSIVLPAKVKIKEVSAELKNSILTVKIPKIEKEVQKININ